MATPAQWVEGARPRTLPAAVAPVVAGTGAAAHADAFDVGKALLALVVALALQVGVNYANDYSDGIRGTDDDRVGPLRLVGSGAAAPAAVRRAAFGCFGVAAVAGLVLAATSGWWLVGVGAVAIAAAWFYTGGSRPYGYRGLGELFVFCFFGLVAVCGTTYVQVGTVTGPSLLAGVAVGALACAILVGNNLRDIPTDELAGKRTLAVVLGDRGTRSMYVALLVAAFVLLAVLAVATPATVLGLVALPFAVRAARPVLAGMVGRDLVPVLRDTGLAELAWAVGVAVGLALGAP
ncbi:MAG: 1,4-dihydroxy-2-naphthoateoctaprenyltransferase [Nocardioidaceae bacterium]|nr:1,4-dihydroxy-2-naphthoateoctaprenyltransferase [Nocardioidaceae bacterium]